MAGEKISAEIGFDGGQVIPVRLGEEQLKELRAALSEDRNPHQVETEEGLLVLDLGKVIFLRISTAPKTIGF